MSTTALARVAEASPAVIDDVRDVDVAVIEEIVRGDMRRHFVVGAVTGGIAVVGTAVLSAIAPPVAFAMIPAYVVGALLAARHGGKAAAQTRTVSRAVYDRIESARREVLRRQLKKDIRDFDRDDVLGKSPARIAREIKAVLDADNADVDGSDGGKPR